MQQTFLILLAAILIGVRLPAFFEVSIHRREQIAIVVIIYVTLGLTVLAVNGLSSVLTAV